MKQILKERMKHSRKILIIKENRGITLIALVVTIVVLLILAGASIAMLTGNNSIINQSKEAKEEVEISDEEEMIELSVVQASEKDILGELTETNFREALESNIGEGKYSLSTEGNEFIVKYKESQREYEVDKDGNISVFEPIDAVVVAKNATEYYGSLVENYNVTYDATEGATNAWRIFYADGEDVEEEDRHIYLIADDYIHCDYVPKSDNYTIYSSYKLIFKNVDNNYTGSASIDSSFASKWLSSYWKNNSTSEKNNIKAVACMLDTSIWNSTFRNIEYADYAIGGPTLEMYCASYKDTHPSRYIECEAESNTVGYNVKWSDEESSYTTFISGLATSDDFNSIYIKNDDGKASTMWLASPSAFSSYGIMTTRLDGLVTAYRYDYYDNYFGPGLRPLVCLSSDIQLKKLDNGNYKIVKTTE
jgi:Tfp pilus assembly protein PilE